MPSESDFELEKKIRRALVKGGLALEKNENRRDTEGMSPTLILASYLNDALGR